MTRSRTRTFYIHTLSPLHCGTGQSSSGIDLPIARERHTGHPIVPGSSLKGVLRGLSQDPALLKEVFGPDTLKAADHAGGVQFGDALLTFLPVRSIAGTFAWATCPTMVRRLNRVRAESGQAVLPKLEVVPEGNGVWVTPNSKLVSGGRVVLEDLDFSVSMSADLSEFAGQVASECLLPEDKTFFVDRVLLVHDDVMATLLETALEITARNAIDAELGTVRKGALWTEEALPTESILVGRIAATPVKVDGKIASPETLLDHVASLLGGTLQLGGHTNIGRGLCRLVVQGGK